MAQRTKVYVLKIMEIEVPTDPGPGKGLIPGL